jgi:hypothetical protein
MEIPSIEITGERTTYYRPELGVKADDMSAITDCQLQTVPYPDAKNIALLV